MFLPSRSTFVQLRSKEHGISSPFSKSDSLSKKAFFDKLKSSDNASKRYLKICLLFTDGLVGEGIINKCFYFTFWRHIVAEAENVLVAFAFFPDG